jgi:RNA polymerase sigma factor (sigma-70 family)
VIDLTLQLEYQESDLINACIARERWAQKKLYEDNYGKMMAVCLRYANNQDDALDIMHEGFIKIYKYISKYEIGTSLIAWMRRVMVNTAIDFYRKNARKRADNIDEAYDLSTDAPDAIAQCSEQDILKAIQKLTPSYRTVFNLYVIEGYSHKEIGIELDITESTSRSNLVKARLKLQNILTGTSQKYD